MVDVASSTPSRRREDTATRISDEALLADLRAGQDDAFTELYARHYRSAAGVARRVVGRGPAVDDVVAESFTSFLSAVHRGGGPSGNVRSYLLTTVRNTAIGFLRAQERAVPAEAEVVDRPHHDADGLVAADDAHRIRQAFAALPARWRRVLWYVDVHELPPAQAGPLLGVSPNATSSLARRARERLRREYLQAHQDRVAPGCEDYAPHLARYVEESLAVPVHHRIEGHVLACVSCATVVEQMRDLRRRMRAVLLPLGLPLAAAGWDPDDSGGRGAEGPTPGAAFPAGARLASAGVALPRAALRGARALGRRWWWARPRDGRRAALHVATVAVVCLFTLAMAAASDIVPDDRAEDMAGGVDLSPWLHLDLPPGPTPPPDDESRPEPTPPTPTSTPSPTPEPTPTSPTVTTMSTPAPASTPVAVPSSPPASTRTPSPDLAPPTMPPSGSTPAPAPDPEPTPDPTSPPTSEPAPDPPLLEIVVGGETVVRVP